MICEYCKKKIAKRKKTIKYHINVSQNTQAHVFCSNKCRDNWCIDVQKNKLRTIIVWNIGIISEIHFFTKKKEYSIISPNGTQNSYFSKDFNSIKNPEALFNVDNLLLDKTCAKISR